MFNLFAGNGEVILTSERYAQKTSAQGGIQVVKANAPHDSCYERKTSTAREPYFVLKAVGNNEILGTSEMYSSAGAGDKGIESVKSNAPTATVDDQA